MSRFGPQGDHRLNLGAVAGLGGRSRSDADGPYLALVGYGESEMRIERLAHLTREEQLRVIERIKPQWEAEGLRVEEVL